MLTRGSAKHTWQQLQDELDRLGARFAVNSGTSFVAATIEVKRENLPKVLALLTEVLQKPTFPAEAQARTLPSGSAMETIVLLNELLMCATP